MSSTFDLTMDASHEGFPLYFDLHSLSLYIKQVDLFCFTEVFKSHLLGLGFIISV